MIKSIDSLSSPLLTVETTRLEFDRKVLNSAPGFLIGEKEKVRCNFKVLNPNSIMGGGIYTMAL